MAVVAAMASTSPAQAQVPAATGNNAVITVKVGGSRTGVATVTPVPGVTLVLYDGSSATMPGASATPLPNTWATCTSDADGDCSFIIPDTGVGGANRDRRFYVAQVSAPPAGWYFSPNVVTSMDGVNYAPMPYMARTGAQLRAGTVYTSLQDFMVTSTDDTASTGVWPESLDNPVLPPDCGLNVAIVLDMSYSVQEASALPDLKAAAKGLTNSLVGTSSQVALFTFGISAPALGASNQNRPLTPVSTQAGADVVNGWIDGLSITTPESTNWDRGLYQVAQQQATLASTDKMYDLVIVLTDGDPTRFGPTSSAVAPSNGIATRYAELEQAIFSANAVKARGTRIVAVGVGDGVATSALNLAAISGPTANSDYYTVGWQDAAATLQGMALAGCAAAMTGSVTVIKQVVPEGVTDLTQAAPFGGWNMTVSSPTISVDGAATASQATAVGTGAASFNLDFGAETSGTVTIDEDTAGQAPPLNDYVHLGTDGQPIASTTGDYADCTLLTSDGPQPLAVTPGTGDAFSVDVSPGDVASCVIYNQVATSPSMTLQVDKVWNIDGTTYAQGQQPPDFSATYAFTATEPDTLETVTNDNLSWGLRYRDITAADAGTITESVSLPQGCYWDAETPAAQLQPADPSTGALTGSPTDMTVGTPTDGVYTVTGGDVAITQGTPGTVGANRFRVTNTVTCQAYLVLANVVNTPGDFQLPPISAFDWDLSAIDLGSGVQTTPPLYTYPTCDAAEPGEPCYQSNAYSIAQPMLVSPLSAYSLVESGNSPDTGAYVQYDIHAGLTKPADAGTGSWFCYGIDPATGTYTGLINSGLESGQVVIPYGVQYVECVAMNSTSELTSDKIVSGGTATPADWTESATPVTPVTAGAPTVTDQPWDQAQRLRPEQSYRISESAGPADYTLTDLTCSWTAPNPRGDPVVHTNEDVLANPVITLDANTTADCTFTNTYAPLAGPPPTPSTPGTPPTPSTPMVPDTGGSVAGGTGLWVPSLTIALAAAALWVRRRHT